MRILTLLVGVALLATLAVACLAPVAEAASDPPERPSTQRKALRQARKHARTHARCLGRAFPKALQRTASVKKLRRYINRTWRQMRYPNWRRRGADAWLALALHAGWKPAQIPMLRKVLYRESRGNPNCRLGVHRGLLQIRADHAPGVNLWNPYSNLRVGLMLYKRLGWRPWACTAY